MDLKAQVRRLDAFQRRHAAVGVPYAVIKKFSDEGASDAAALIAYWGFFSIFPLLLLFTAALGFVLHGDHSAEQTVLDSALKEFPLIGPAIKHETLSGNGLGLAIGILGALVSGLGVTLAAQRAFNLIYAIPRRARAGFLNQRLRGLKVLVVVGLLQVVSTVVSGIVSGGLGGVGLTIAGIIVSLALNVLLFFAAFRFLVDDSVPTRQLWLGIVLAAVGWEILQAVGGVYVGHVLKGAKNTYGTFATVIGFLVWLYLGARIVVLAAETNVVVTRRLWPRGLMDPPTAADHRAMTSQAKIQERDDQTIDVHFAEDSGEEA
jgi:YihY family inner membrane protein